MISKVHGVLLELSPTGGTLYNQLFNPLTAGAVHMRFFTFVIAHYISAFKHVKDKT